MSPLSGGRSGRKRPCNSRRRFALAKVSLRNIVKRFGAARLFEGFNLEVVDGELLCLLGPSGSGKTTLLRMIAGLEELDDGDIFVGDREISRLSPRDRQIGMMFQGYALYPHLSVRENLAYPLRVRHVPRERHRAARRRCRAAAGHRASARPAHPAGQRRRAAAGGHRPRHRTETQSLSCSTNRSAISTPACASRCAPKCGDCSAQLGATMIMVTHDQLDALAIADRIAVLRKGVLQQCGAPEELYLNPANRICRWFHRSICA